VPRVPLSQITFDEDIYPRRTKSNVTIKSYVEALKGGAEFPPLTVQKVQDNGTVFIISLDGIHRHEAYHQFNKIEDVTPIKEINVDYYKENTLDKQEDLEELRILAVQLNLKHGLRISDADIGFQAERIVKDRPIEKLTGIQKQLADKFGRDESYLSKLVGALVRQRRASRDSQIYKMSLEGWTQQKISDIIGTNRSRVSQIVNNFPIQEINNAFYIDGVNKAI